MYGFSGNSNPKTLPKIFYYEPKTNSIVTLLRFGNETLIKSDKTLTEDNSVVVEKSSGNRIVIKYTTEPDSVNLDLMMGDNTEGDMLAIVTKEKKLKYPFDAPIDKPLLLNGKLYGLFGTSETPKNGGIFSFDLNTKKLQIIEYYSSNAHGNLLPSNNKLLYANYNSVIDSISLENKNYFDKNKDRPYGFINKKNDVFYYFPYTLDALHRKTPLDSTSKVVIRFGIDKSYNLSRKKFNIELSKEWDLAKIYIKN